MNSEKRKPYRNYSWAVFIVVILVAITLIQTVLQARKDFFDGSQLYIFIVLAILGGFFGYTIVYFIGKLIFGKIAGFRLININLLILRFTRIEGKIHMEFSSPDGWGGSVLMAPNRPYDRCYPILYHFGGTIVSILTMVISSLIALSVDPTKKIGYIVLSLACVGILVLIVNLFPCWVDYVSDGFAIRLLIRKENRKPYLDNLLQEESLLTGYHQLTDEYVYERYDDTLQARSLVYRYYFYMNNKQYKEARDVLKLMIENKGFLPRNLALLAQTMELYFVLLEKSDEEAYDYYYSLDRQDRNYAVSLSSFENIKVGLLVACKVEKSYELYQHIKKGIKKTEDNYYFTRREYEEELIKKSIALVEEKYKEWKNEN